MASVNFKLESGIQLLARLRKKTDIGHFYPKVFEDGPKYGEVIEIIFRDSATCFLMDIIAEALIPSHLGGIETGVLFLNTDGNMNLEEFINVLRKKLLSRTESSQEQISEEMIYNMLQSTLTNFHSMDIYEPVQLYTTIHNLESVLDENPNISLIVFDTLTAFYWSEQGFKLTKMDMYLKNLLRLIQKITNDYKITILYTRPEYFNSSKESFENLEGCANGPKLEHVNYKVLLESNEDNSYQVNVKTYSKLFKKRFIIMENEIKWQ